MQLTILVNTEPELNSIYELLPLRKQSILMKALYLIFITIFSLFFWQCSTESQKVDLPPDNKGELSMPDKNKEQKENGDRDTSGFYETYRYTNRFVWQKPDIIINLFGDLSGKTIADIGTGLGYFSLRLAKKAQKVIAIDIDANMTKYIDSIKVLELPEPYQNRLETRLALPMDPKLNTEEVDGAVIVNTYMYIPNRKKIFGHTQKRFETGRKVSYCRF